MAQDMQQHLQAVDRRSAGGLPGRAAIDAWFQIQAEPEMRQIEPHEYHDLPMTAVMIDTEKFFDAVPHHLAVDLLLAKGVRKASAMLWADQIVNHVKFLFLGMYADPKGMRVERGIPQGDAVSMFAALVVMEKMDACAQ